MISRDDASTFGGLVASVVVVVVVVGGHVASVVVVVVVLVVSSLVDDVVIVVAMVVVVIVTSSSVPFVAADTVVLLKDSVSLDGDDASVTGVVVSSFASVSPSKCVSGGVHPSEFQPDECPGNVGLLSILSGNPSAAAVRRLDKLASM